MPVFILVALAAVYVVCFTDWLKPRHIHIFHTVREVHARRRATDPERVVIFGLDPRDIRLTEVKVVPLAEFEKNPETLPVWHLVSDSNSVPVKTFFYGEYIRGMRPNLKGAGPEALQTNVTYRMFVRAGKAAGQHDFDLQE